MAEVLLLCMRDDEEAAAILADLFYRAGFQTAGGAARPEELDACAVALVCWSGASQRSTQMREAADRAAQSGKAMIARLDGHPLPPSLWRLPAFDLSQWSFAPEDPVLDGLYVAVERTVTRARDAATRMGRVAPSAEPPVPPRGQTVSGNDLEAEAAFWKRIQNSSNPADFLEYLDQFGPKGAFAELALIRLERLGGAPPKAQPAAARAAPAKAEPAAPAWTGWSVSPGSVRPPRYDQGPDSIDDRLDRRQPESRRPAPPPQDPPPPPRRPIEPTPDPYLREPRQPEPPRAAPTRPTPPRLDPVAPDARRAEPRRPDPRYMPPPGPPEDSPYRPAARRPTRYDEADDGYRAPPPRAGAGRTPERVETPDRAEGGGGRGLLVVLVAIAALGGAGYAMRGLLPSGGGEDKVAVESRADPSLASTGAELSASLATPPATPDSALTPPPRGESVPLDSIVTETAPSASRRQPAQPAAQPAPTRLASSARGSGAIGADPNAAYVPPPSASLPPTEAPISVQPAPLAAPAPIETRPATPAGPTADSTTRAPARVRWVARPTSDRLAALYPSRARSADVEGSALLRCTILTDGRAACTVQSETPQSYGFGNAALRASEALRSAPTLDDGSSATGAITDVSIRFQVR